MKYTILASNNAHKLDELKEKLKPFNINVISQKEAGYDIEVDETGETFKENAILKAEAIYNLSKMPVIADDSGLEIDALDGKPGVHSKRFAGENTTDYDRIKKILTMMKDVEKQKRTARFKTVICYINEYGEKHIFEGVVEGEIGCEAKGTNGFGYDPIFIYNNKTFAEMTSEEKNEVSHRGRATQKLIDYLSFN